MSVLFLLMLSLTLSVDENQVCLHTLSSPICSSLSERAQERGRGTRRRENGVQKIFPVANSSKDIPEVWISSCALPTIRSTFYHLPYSDYCSKSQRQGMTPTHTHILATAGLRRHLSKTDLMLQKKINLLNKTDMHTHNGYVCLRCQKTIPLFIN